ncbi:hypothetical protein ACGTN6_17995 [Halomonas sp. THAF12]|uniref:hypothetical protein n=1 Tax=Halomonas sp. B23F22_10 TaxID=3459515 RepID=UPI00373E0CB0
MLTVNQRLGNEFFLGYIERQAALFNEKYKNNFSSLGRYYAWDVTYWIESSLLAFESTCDSRYLFVLTNVIGAICGSTDFQLGREDVIRGRVLKAWGTDRQYSKKVLDNNLYTNITTHAGRICTSLLWFSRLALASEEAELKDVAHLAKNVALDALREFDDCYKLDENLGGVGYYQRLLSGEVEALNHITSVAEAYYLAHCMQPCDESIYKKFLSLNKFISSSLYLDSSGKKVWNYQPYPNNAKNGSVEPVWKAQITIRYFWRIYTIGFSEVEVLLPEVAETIYKNVFRCGNFSNVEEIFSKVSGKGLTMGDVENKTNPSSTRRYIDLLPFVLLIDAKPEIFESIWRVVEEFDSADWIISHPRGSIAYAYLLRFVDSVRP